MGSGTSGLYSGTVGDTTSEASAEDIIALRVVGFDLREHPIGQVQLSGKAKKVLSQKVVTRTATKEEYKRLQWDRRFSNRRKTGIKLFWKQERRRLLRGESGTRNWSPEQREAIISKKPVQFNGVTLQAHHTYSAALYPHLANKGEVIYPATSREHRESWHGGSYKKSMPGKRIRRMSEF